MSAPERAVEYLAATAYTRAEVVLSRPNPVPAAPGVYGWWFRELPADIDISDCEVKDGLVLLYTSISPKKPPSKGRPPSSQHIRSRVTTHYTCNAAGSTLRLTLGCLLADTLGIELRRFGSGRRFHFGSGELALSRWMHSNALVSWITTPDPWLTERELIAYLDLPLKLQGNQSGCFHTELTAVRAAARKRASALPVLANLGSGGRYIPGHDQGKQR
ncbi:GIY-YIG nuclease family protein [Nocardia testacea]|uniref:GIY-YIG nuclease family protein n=1 Tax=Nocardia testacea TaxID=248551 RepID=UPI003C3082A4